MFKKITLIAVIMAVLQGTLVSAQETAPAQLPLVPAEHVGHATQAMLLAGARAGKRIVAAGDHGVVLLSDSNGKSFRQAKAVPVDSTLTALSFVNEREGWAAGQWGVILHSADGGETWAVQRSDTATDRPLFAIHFFDAKSGVAVGLWSLILRTNDGGVSWKTVQIAPPDGAKKADLNLLSLFDDGHGRLYATAEKGMLLRTDDQGQTWSYLSTGYKGSFWAGVASGDGALLAGGLRGSLFRSVDEGKTWARIDTGGKSSITSLVRVGREIVAVGLDGLMLHSKDGGASFMATPRADRLSLTSVVAAADEHAVVFSRQGIVADEK